MVVQLPELEKGHCLIPPPPRPMSMVSNGAPVVVVVVPEAAAHADVMTISDKWSAASPPTCAVIEADW
jgi:hypothetical protein